MGDCVGVAGGGNMADWAINSAQSMAKVSKFLVNFAIQCTSLANRPLM